MSQLPIHHRDGQRRDAIRIRQQDVGAVLHQHLDAGAAVLADGIQQRREAAGVGVLVALLLRDVAFEVAHDGARVHVGALRGQQLDHLGVMPRGGPHQRGLAAEAFGRIHVGAAA